MVKNPVLREGGKNPQILRVSLSPKDLCLRDKHAPISVLRTPWPSIHVLLSWYTDFFSSPDGNSICFPPQVSKNGTNQHCWVTNILTCCISPALTSADTLLHALHVIHWIFLISKYYLHVYYKGELLCCLSSTATARISLFFWANVPFPSSRKFPGEPSFWYNITLDKDGWVRVEYNLYWGQLIPSLRNTAFVGS